MNDTLTLEEEQAVEEHTERIYQDRVFAIEELCTITNKYAKLVPFKLWPHQKKLLKYILEAEASPNKTIILAPKIRQNGTSKVCCGNNVVESRLYDNRNSLYLIKSDDDTQPFFDDKVKQIDDNLPEEWKGKKVRDQSTSLKYDDTKSSVRIQTAGASEAVSSKKGRSGSEKYIHVTEAAFIAYLEVMYRALRGSMPPDGVLLLESTMDGPRNFFYEMCMGVKNNEGVVEIEKNVWKDEDNRYLIFLSFWEFEERRAPKPDNFKIRDNFEKEAFESIINEGGCEESAYWYIKEYRGAQTRPDCSDAQVYMRREQPITLMEGFMDSERDYFTPAKLKGLKAYIDAQDRKSYQFGLMRIKGADGKQEIQTIQPDKVNCVNVWAPPELGWKNRYFLFVDPAKGGIHSDYDSFHVFDRVAHEEVANVHAKLGGKLTARMAMMVGAWYDNAWISGDATGGYLEATKFFLLKHNYPNLHSRREVDNIQLEHEFFGIVWSDVVKYAALAQLKYMWEEGYWRVWDPGMYDEAKVFGYPEDGKTPCAAEGFHDDKIMDFAGIAYVEPKLPAPVKTEDVKPFKPVNKVQKIRQEALKRRREASGGYSGMGNWD